MSGDSHSVTRWIERLRDNDPHAAAALWQRFMERMLAVARRRLGEAPRRVADEEDVVVVAFERFLDGVRQGRFPKLNDRDDLWAILFTLTNRMAARQARDQGRLKRVGSAHPEERVPGELIDDEPTPAEAASIQDSLARLLAGLDDDELRRIALARMEGYSNSEIATTIKRTEVTVERRLRLIRAAWRQMGLEIGEEQ